MKPLTGFATSISLVLALLLSRAAQAEPDGAAENKSIGEALAGYEAATASVNEQMHVLAAYDAKAPPCYLRGDPYDYPPDGRNWAQKRAGLGAELGRRREAQQKELEKVRKAIDAYKAATARMDDLIREARDAAKYIRETPGGDPSNRGRALRTIQRDLGTLGGADYSALGETLDALRGMVNAGRPLEYISRALDEMAGRNPALKAFTSVYGDMLKDVVMLPAPEGLQKVNTWLGRIEKLGGFARSLGGAKGWLPKTDPMASPELESLGALLDAMKEFIPDELAPLKAFMTVEGVLLEGIQGSLKSLEFELAKRNLNSLREFGTTVERVNDPTTRFLLYPKVIFGKVEKVGFNLNGMWSSVGWVPSEPAENGPLRVKVSVIGNHLVGALLDGNKYVPAGQTEIDGTVADETFAVKELFAYPGFVDPRWMDASIRIVDEDHFELQQPEGRPAVTFTRVAEK